MRHLVCGGPLSGQVIDADPLDGHVRLNGRLLFLGSLQLGAFVSRVAVDAQQPGRVDLVDITRRALADGAADLDLAPLEKD